MFLANPMTTIVAIASLSLGIGANTTIFSLMNALILRPLPVHHPEELIRLSMVAPNDRERDGPLSLAAYEEIRRDQRVLSGLFAWSGGGIVNIDANGEKYAGSLSTVSGEYFSTLGIRPALGRLIQPSDLSLDSGLPAPVAVLAYGCWQRRFNGDTGVIGRTIRVQDRSLTIIGVTPKNFAGLIIDGAPDVTVPIGYSGRTSYRDREIFGFDVYARIKPGIGIDHARVQLQSIWPAVLRASIPGSYAETQRDSFLSRRLIVTSASTGKSFLRERYRRPILILLGMVGLLLLTACANLANLTIAGAEGRRREFGIRMSLGARRGRLVRQLLTESLLLSGAGTLVGFLLAQWATQALVGVMWTGLVPLALNTSPDLRVLVFTIGLLVVTGVISGVSPAGSIGRSDPTSTLQRHRGTLWAGPNFLVNTLMASQVALSLVLVIGAALFIRSLNNLRSVDVGYRRDGVLIVQLFPSFGSESQHMANRVAYYHELTERLRNQPGIESVSYSHNGPVASYEDTAAASVSSFRTGFVQATSEVVGPDFFHLIGMRVLAGREFNWHDDEISPPVAIVSESLARRLFPSRSPIGQKIDFDQRKGLQIVGIVNSASLWKPQSKQPAAVYLPLMQMPTYNSSFLDIRVGGNPTSVLSVVRQQLESLGRQFALRTQTLDQRLNYSLVTERVIAMLSSFFGFVALLLASIGLYGLAAVAVTRRTAEIGIRMALGAQPGGVLMIIMKEVIWLVFCGLALGIPAALGASRLISGLLFGVEGSTAHTILLCSAILASAAALAAYLPARRASRVEPMTALRAQ
jgi:predicted permease